MKWLTTNLRVVWFCCCCCFCYICWNIINETVADIHRNWVIETFNVILIKYYNINTHWYSVAAIICHELASLHWIRIVSPVGIKYWNKLSYENQIANYTFDTVVQLLCFINLSSLFLSLCLYLSFDICMLLQRFHAIALGGLAFYFSLLLRIINWLHYIVSDIFVLLSPPFFSLFIGCIVQFFFVRFVQLFQCRFDWHFCSPIFRYSFWLLAQLFSFCVQWMKKKVLHVTYQMYFQRQMPCENKKPSHIVDCHIQNSTKRTTHTHTHFVSNRKNKELLHFSQHLICHWW